MRELVEPFNWLEESMTVNVAHNVSDPNVGFALSEDDSTLKCYMGDTGLLVSHAFADGESLPDGIAWKILTGKIEINKGMLMENVVAQMLRASGRKLFFHHNSSRDNAADRMEIDFLLNSNEIKSRRNIIAVEVKSAKDYTTVSLDKFRRKFPNYLAKACILHPGDLSENGETMYLPLYMAGLLGEFGVARKEVRR